jgi:hypothetical protein
MVRTALPRVPARPVSWPSSSFGGTAEIMEEITGRNLGLQVLIRISAKPVLQVSDSMSGPVACDLFMSDSGGDWRPFC